jgi:hypothetical protein
MHNIGQSHMEHSLGEYGSPLHEILSQELAPEVYGEATYGEAPYGEAAYAGEATYGEAPYGETAYAGEAAYSETAGEAPYGEAAYGETAGEAPYGETAYGETAYAGEAAYGETAYGETAYAGEAAYGETAYAGEAAYGETPMLEATAGEYHESSFNSEVLSEEEEMALASELLEVQNEEQLDLFLGKLFRRVVRVVPGFIRSHAGRILTGVLKKVAKVALPVAAGAVGTFVGGPAGGLAAGALAGAASRAMGLELTAMAPQEADFAAAKQFVRFAADAAHRTQLGAPAVPAPAAVSQAVRGAATRYAPALVGSGLPRVRVPSSGDARRGVWVRRGRTIIIYGV